MNLVNLKELLLTITPNVFHYEAHAQTGNYIVWAEDGQSDSLYADDCMSNQVLQGTIDYFTKIEFDTVFEEIQSKLNSLEELTWRLNSIQNEKDTGYIHYEWIFEVVNDIG